MGLRVPFCVGVASVLLQKITQAKKLRTKLQLGEYLPQVSVGAQHMDIDEAYEQVLLAETSIRQAKENLKENEDNYKAGLIQVSDLLEAQAQLQQSSDQYTDAVINYQTGKVTYLQVCGE